MFLKSRNCIPKRKKVGISLNLVLTNNIVISQGGKTFSDVMHSRFSLGSLKHDTGILLNNEHIVYLRLWFDPI